MRNNIFKISEEMLPRWYMDGDIIGSFRFLTTSWCVTIFKWLKNVCECIAKYVFFYIRMHLYVCDPRISWSVSVCWSVCAGVRVCLNELFVESATFSCWTAGHTISQHLFLMVFIFNKLLNCIPINAEERSNILIKSTLKYI